MSLPLSTSHPIPAAHLPCPPEDLQGDGRWHSIHQRYCADARGAEPEVLFVGDSLFAHMERVGDIWQRWFAPLHSLNFGLSGDCTQNLLWRLQNGELDCIRPKAVVVLIGTNNFLHSAEQVLQGIVAVVETVRERQPQAKIFLCTLLPRGQYPNRLREKNRETNLLLKAHFGKRGDVVSPPLPLMATQQVSSEGKRAKRLKCSSPSAVGPSLKKRLKESQQQGSVDLIDIDAGFVQTDGTISHLDLYDYLHMTERGYEKAFLPVLNALKEHLRVDEDDLAPEEADAVLRSASMGSNGEGDNGSGVDDEEGELAIKNLTVQRQQLPPKLM